MSDAISKALQDSERVRLQCRQAANSSRSMLSDSLTSGVGGLSRGSSMSSASEQYKHHRGWVAVCVRAISQRIASQDIFVSRLHSQPFKNSIDKLTLPNGFKHLGSRLEPLESHSLLNALHHPNDVMTRWHLINFTIQNLELTGRSFLWYSDGQIWALPSSWVQPSDNLKSSFVICPTGYAEGFEVDGLDIINFYLPDPQNPFGSLSPLQLQSEAVATDEAIQTSQHRSFKNGIFPQMMIKAGRLPGMQAGQQGERPVLEPEQRQELISTIRAMYRGAVNFGEPLIVDGLLESVERLTDKPSEMDFTESSKLTKSRILQAFGLNPAIVGELENVNRASAVVAEKMFCSSTINPLLEMMSQTLSNWASRRFNESLAVWLAPCVANDEELEIKRWESAARLGYVTGNEYRRQILNLPDIPELGKLIDPLTGKPRKASESFSNRLEPSLNGHSN